MIAGITFQFPLGWLIGVPAVLFLAFAARQQYCQGLSPRRIAAMAALRGTGLLILIFLAAQPIWMAKGPTSSLERGVVLLVDRSESMSIQDQEKSRYGQSISFAAEKLLPALKSAHITAKALLFDEAAEPADRAALESTVPKGKRTNLAGAIAQALANQAQPPLAVIALTDGIGNETADNSRALTALVEAKVPFIGVGFGNDQGVQTLTLREVSAPTAAASKMAFNVSAQLEIMNADGMPAFDLLLMRDGLVTQKRTVTPVNGSRTWLENFQLSEEQEGLHNYTVQLLPPASANVKCVSLLGSTSVRVSDEKELRILYIQGALTWDYKFINMALRSDQTIKLTGLTRTSKQSVFRQNVESAGEFMQGFPSTLEELAPFRVIVLSNLRPADLSAAQQETLARFCGEMGGGLLMVGGPATFDSSWANSRLEQLLPVVFTPNPGVQGLDRPFRVELTEEALQHPVFQIAENRAVREVWGQLPTFTQFGRVDAPKPAAQIWIQHQTEDGPQGRRILMASQRYGAGLSAVLSIQNFWRWRLAKDSDPAQFDRFWRQLFRFLSEVGRQDIGIHLADQDLHPEMDVEVVLEKQPNPKNITDTSHKFLVKVEDRSRRVLHEQAVELKPLRPVNFKFHAGAAGVYTVTVTDSLKVPISSRPIEIRDVNVEFQTTARDMETLRQWASVSDGLAFKVEECPAGADLVAQIRAKVQAVQQGKQLRRIFGINGWTMLLVLSLLGGEWALRKKWNLA